MDISKAWNPGRFLRMEPPFPVQYCQIVKSFEGQLGKGFTNSCTLLVELVGELPTWLQDHRVVVIKAIDPNFCHTIREDFNLMETVFEKTAIKTATEAKEEAGFRAWIAELVPQEKLQDAVLTVMIKDEQLPARPTYGDVLVQGLQMPGFQDMMVEQKIVRTLSSRERQTIIEDYCENSFRYEALVLSYLSKNDSSHIFPIMFGSTRISCSSPALPMEDDITIINAPALVMEYVKGQTLAQWVAQHSEEIKTMKYGGFERLARDVSDICKGCVVANAVPLVFGFEHNDVRLDNYQLCRDPTTDRLKVRLLDAGSQLFVRGFHRCDDNCGDIPGTEVSSQCPMVERSWQGTRFYTSYGSSIADDMITYMLKDAFGVVSCLNGHNSMVSYRLGLFDSLNKPLDTIIWQVIQQSLWHFTNKKMAVEMICHTTEVLRISSSVMRQTIATSPPQIYWGWIAFQRICHIFYGDDSLELLRQFLRILITTVNSFNDQDVKHLDEHLDLHHKLVGIVVDQVASFKHQIWRGYEGPLNDFVTWLEGRATSICALEPDVKGILKILRRSGAYHIDLLQPAVSRNTSSSIIGLDEYSPIARSANSQSISTD